MHGLDNFPEKDLLGHSSNFHIHVPLSDPTIDLPVCCRTYVDRSWYINRSRTDECWNWDWGREIPWTGIHKWDFHCSAGVQEIKYRVAKATRWRTSTALYPNPHGDYLYRGTDSEGGSGGSFEAFIAGVSTGEGMSYKREHCRAPSSQEMPRHKAGQQRRHVTSLPL